jgi:hypothetical protein
MKSFPVKVVNNSFRFDIADYNYNNKITLLTHNFKVKC